METNRPICAEQMKLPFKKSTCWELRDSMYPINANLDEMQQSGQVTVCLTSFVYNALMNRQPVGVGVGWGMGGVEVV